MISSGDIGAPPRFAVPDFIALAGASARDRAADAETADAARTIARVLWDDLNFEREFALIPRDVYKTIPPATSMARRSARSLARAQRRRRRHRIGAEDRRRRARRGPPVQRAQRPVGVQHGVQRIDRQRARLRAHDRRRHPQDAAQPARRGADPADLQFRPRRRAAERHGREPRLEGDLHFRLRRREPAADDRQPRLEHHVGLVAGRPIDRLRLVAARTAQHLPVEHLLRPGAAGPDQERRQQLDAGLLSRRHADRVQLEPRRQPRDLRR